MGKHTKFDSSDDDSSRSEKRDNKEVRKEKKKKEKRDRSRSPHKEQEKSPRKDRYEEKDDSRRRDDKDHHGRRRDYERDDRRDEKRDDRRGERNNWGRDRNDRKDRRSDFSRREEKSRLSAEEVAAQRKALWGNKKTPVDASSTASDSATTSSDPVSGGKNEKLWSSAIAATGVESSQANKFMRLMGVKNAPKPESDSSTLSAEKNRQNKMLNDLEKQYAVARETTHMGRGTGFGFGH